MHSTDSSRIGKTPETPLCDRRFPVSGTFSIVGFQKLTGIEAYQWNNWGIFYAVDVLIHTAHAGSIPRRFRIGGARDLETFRSFARVALSHGAVLDHPARRTGKAGREGREQWEREAARMMNRAAVTEVARHG